MDRCHFAAHRWGRHSAHSVERSGDNDSNAPHAVGVVSDGAVRRCDDTDRGTIGGER